MDRFPPQADILHLRGMVDWIDKDTFSRSDSDLGHGIKSCLSYLIRQVLAGAVLRSPYLWIYSYSNDNLLICKKLLTFSIFRVASSQSYMSDTHLISWILDTQLSWLEGRSLLSKLLMPPFFYLTKWSYSLSSPPLSLTKMPSYALFPPLDFQFSLPSLVLEAWLWLKKKQHIQ